MEHNFKNNSFSLIALLLSFLFEKAIISTLFHQQFFLLPFLLICG